MIHDLLQKLREEIPAQYVKHKILGETKITFISWYDTAKLLDERLGDQGLWHWAVDKVSNSADRIYVVGTLTLESFEDNRKVSFSATGTELLKCSSFGDPSSNAEAMAFKRASAKAGLGRQFYYKEDSKNNKINPLEYKFTFGKYRGKTIAEVQKTDKSYLTWLKNNGKAEIKGILAEYLKLTK